MTLQIPSVDAHTALRNVLLGETGYRLFTWDTGRHHGTGQRNLGYAFYEPGIPEPLFLGEDYGCAPSQCIDSDDALRGLLGFLTLQVGDTDPEFFDNYTERQLAWADAHAESLQEWGMESCYFEDSPRLNHDR